MMATEEPHGQLDAAPRTDADSADQEHTGKTASHRAVALAGRGVNPVYWRCLLVALLAIAFSAVVRVICFGDQGRIVPYVTYYPAVILAALYGGAPAGLTATAAVMFLCYFWQYQRILSPSEWLGLAVFSIACVMISLVCEGMRRARKRVRLAQEKLENANEALRREIVVHGKTERKFKDLLEATPDAIVAVGRNGEIVLVNVQTVKLFGWSREELLGRNVDILLPKRYRCEEGPERNVYFTWPKPQSVREESGLSGLRKDGTEFPLEISLSPLETDDGVVVVSAIRDISLQKKHEGDIVRLSQLYAALSQINQAIVSLRDRDELFARICRVLVEYGGLSMAWVGLINSETRRVVPAGEWGDSTKYLSRATIYADDRPEGRGPTGTAIRQGRHYICNDFRRDASTLPWREAVELAGFRSSAAFVIRQGVAAIGALTVYSKEVAFFQQREIELLEEAANDVSFALDNMVREKVRQEAEEALRRSELELKAAQRVARVGSWSLAAASGEVRWTEELYRMLGLDPTQPPPPYTEHHRLFTPESWKRLSEAVPRTEKTGVPYELELEMIRADGSRGWMLARGERLQDSQGKLLGLRGVAQDITERIRAEEELRWKTAFLEAQVDSSLDGILVVDAEGKKLLQNQRLIDLWQIPPEIAAGQNNAGQIEFAAHRIKNPRQFLEKVDYLNAHPDEVSRDEVELVDGTILDRYSSAVRDKAGKSYGRIWTFRDITGQRKMEEQLRQSQKMDCVGQLAGGIAHDFNNILGVILMQSELARMEEGTPRKVLDGLCEIKAAAERAANLTRQLLAFSRQQVLQPQALDLNRVVTNLASMLRRVIREDVSLEMHLSRMPMMVEADESMLDQVLLNFAVNARDAMPEGGQLVIETGEKVVDAEHARYNPDASPGRYVLLSVSDTGCGIPKEIQARIFEPFFTTKEAGKGTGLGLATVFGIVKQHRGWIKVYSEVGKATNFQVYLPSIGPVVEASGKEAVKPASRGGVETILVAEDNEFLRKLTQAVLEQAGYRVLAVPNGAEAERIWDAHRSEIALLLTDLVMPGGVSGRELAERLGKQDPTLKIVFTSGYSAEMAGRSLNLQPGQSFLQKPCLRDELLAAVRRALEE